MLVAEILQIIRQGEDSQHQFKENVTNASALAAEMVAFSNGRGGKLLIGVADDGTICGLTSNDIRRLNQLISNASSDNVKNPIHVNTSTLEINGQLMMLVDIPEGTDKPYMDNKGVFWVKSGADKRRVTSKTEIRRLFQMNDLVNADEVIVRNSSLENLDRYYLRDVILKIYQQDIADYSEQALHQLLQNLKLANNERLTLAGLLLFGRYPQQLQPIFDIKAISFWGNDGTGQTYRDSEDIKGNLEVLYKKAMSFLLRNLQKIQGNQGVNSIGILEVPEIVLQELLINALIHRDYFISAPIKLFIFDNRIEIISPGSLPNSLTIENVKNGISHVRNHLLHSFAAQILPYKGIGWGIRRALKAHPLIDLIDDKSAEQFTAIIHRPPKL